MHLKSYPVKGSKLADGTNITGRRIISQGWSKPLLIGTKLGKSFSHTTKIMCLLWSKNVGKVEYAGNGRVQWRWQSALGDVVNNRKQDDIQTTSL